MRSGKETCRQGALAHAPWPDVAGQLANSPPGRRGEERGALPGGEVHFRTGPADALTTLLLTEGDPPSASVAGLDLRPLGDDPSDRP
ncbi:hypothetical protein OG596_37335 [Streptomyces sp. NBC_01102]|uniref:hypothetical protein n=1 Tax=unclassified Streptomyces TaxID=2593676 RepID=UPI0038674E25|nr:hypothetical protein OG596_37335 [Streptomyces sp. NBC_01102]